MRYIFLLLAFAIAGNLSAQDDQLNDRLKKHMKPLIVPTPKFEDLRAKNYSSLFPAATQKQLLNVLPNGTKVYALPQDHMPCLEPDMSQFNMPNAGRNIQILKYPQPGSIPNPAADRSLTYISMKRTDTANQ